MGSAALIGIDWGTSRLRAFQIDAAGRVLERRDSDRGIITIGDGDFPGVFSSVIEGWPRDLPVLMCGMIGSRQGWLETPYCSCPVRAVDLGRGLGTVEAGRQAIRILGGISTVRGQQYDVMRGEETQIFGVMEPAGSQLVVTPGTHSKWAVIEDAAIRSFRTYMTGELYAVLRAHSILGRLMTERAGQSTDETAFMEGVLATFEDHELLHTLFNVRTQALFGRKQPEELPSYLSGILVGSEVAGALRHHRSDAAVVIATPELRRLYQMAMSAAGLRHITGVDGDHAVVQGLWRLWQLRGDQS